MLIRRSRAETSDKSQPLHCRIVHFFFVYSLSIQIQCTCVVLLSPAKLRPFVTRFILYLHTRKVSSSACRKLARWHLALQESKQELVEPAVAETKQKSSEKTRTRMCSAGVPSSLRKQPAAIQNQQPDQSHSRISSSARPIRARFTGR